MTGGLCDGFGEFDGVADGASWLVCYVEWVVFLGVLTFVVGGWLLGGSV